MHSRINIALISFSILVSFSCQDNQELNEATEREKIMKIHNQQRKNHFQKLLNKSFEPLSDEFIIVNKGEIIEPTRKDFIAQRKNYFESVEFEKWDDIKPPIIRFSDDYKMAYTIVNKQVLISYIDEKNGKQRELTEFS